MSPRAVFLIGTGLALLAATAIGCAASDASVAAGQAYVPSATNPPAEDEDAGTGGSSMPVAAAALPHALGSPLCNASYSYSSCYPDDPNTARPKLCGTLPDGGVYSASTGYDNTQLACHVQAALNSAGVAPTCTVAGTLTDTSTALCSAPTDCQAGYECVVGGACRHYCCAGECFDLTEFCDIQEITGSPIKVPVCMPIHNCGLLDQPSDAGPCPVGQTCAVVRVENGATSCVAVGNSNVGDECDKVQCASGLVCLGTAGDRHCYKLCHTGPGNTDCLATKQTCKGGLPLFPLPGIGICQ